VKTPSVPMLGDTGVRIEADVLDMDPQTFGPIPEKPLRRVLVAFSWSELQHDSDGDGLSDLVEERLVTDPHNRDTDGDGIADGIDPLPQIDSVSWGASAEEELLTMVLSQFPAKWTAFFTGDRLLLAGSSVKARFIVLTRDEADVYRIKFGMTAFGDLSFLLVSHDGRKATLYIDYATAGNTYEFEKKDGVWTRHDRGGWLS